ncbi:MAG: GNAT family N-acetyltransferase [Cellvibrionaceae bacterium]
MNAFKNLIIKKANWELDKTQLQKIRHKVFVEEQKVPEQDEWDHMDETATHYLCLLSPTIKTDNDQRHIPVATARLLPTGQIGRMAVLKEYRTKGIGKMLLQYIIDTHSARPMKSLFLHAQLSAIPFYEKLGFIVTNENEFEDAGIMHKTMEFHYD